MHGAGFHKYNKQRKYLPLWLRGEDVHSICSLSFQLKIDYAVKQLTALPVTESDIRFTWVQISGAEPLEFSDYHAAQPFVVLNPNVTEDMHFKVYIDKGESTQLSSDVWIYRTPTEKTLQYVENINGNRVQGLSVNTKDVNSVPSNISALFPKNVQVIENLRNGLALTEEDILSFDVVAERLQPISNLIGLKVLRFEVYDTETDGLVGLSTKDSMVASIPKSVATFYLKMQISVYNNFEGVTPKIYTITSNKVYTTPIRDFRGNLRVKNIYAKEYVSHVPDTAFIKGAGTLIKDIRLPLSFSFYENATKIPIPSASIGKSLTSRSLNPKSVENTDTSTDINTLNIVNQDMQTTRHIIRYNGITIGG